MARRGNDKRKKMTNFVKIFDEEEEVVSVDGTLLDWTFPHRHTTKSCDYVSFEAKDPATGKLKRKKYMLRMSLPQVERDAMASQLIINITKRLQHGWTPWQPEHEDRRGTPLMDVVMEYFRTLEVEVRKGLKREKTRVDYKCRVEHFAKWALEHNVSVIGHCMDGAVDAYLQWTIVHNNNSPRTRNNHRTTLSAFFGWCIKRHYLKKNPCSTIEQVKNGPKERVPLTDGELKRIQAYLLENDKPFLLAVMMQYYTLIRPKELSYLRLCDISLKEQTATVPERWSKNGREEPVALNDKIIRLMIELDVFESCNTSYLFGRDFLPSKERADERIFRERWSKLRKTLHIPANRKFYSLKDKGIIDLIAQEGAVNARDQARHTSIAVTNKYAQHGGKKVHEETKHFKGKL